MEIIHPHILILVLSYNDHAEYSELMKAQQATWDSIEFPLMKTVYYHGGREYAAKQIHSWSMQIAYPASDDYFEMHWKFKLCLDHYRRFPIPQLIFRTNSSSYIDKKLLHEFAQTLPKEKVYAGWQSSDFISGAGFFLSPDVQEMLAGELKEGRRYEEDVLIGRTLKRLGIGMIADHSRFDVREFRNPPLDRYHYRFKTEDRYQDAENMRRLHELKIMEYASR